MVSRKPHPIPKRVSIASASQRTLARQPLWKGPVEDGITFSLLSKFVVCRERFRLKVVEGLEEDEGFNHNLEFGSLWHAAEEAHAGKHDWKAELNKYREYLTQKYPEALAEVNKWYTIAKVTFPQYVNYWRKHRDESARKPVLEEYAFRVPYKLPSGRVLVLRGKCDCLFRLGKVLYLQENKTKGTIDQEGIQASVSQNLQTMLYQIAIRQLVTEGKPPFESVKNAKVKGVLYNVIRRPLSDRYAIKPRKAETSVKFYERLGVNVKTKADYYFYRWKVLLSNQDIETFKTRVFHPILEQLMDWWESIELNPFDPWNIYDITGAGFVFPNKPNPFHWQAPWGVYSSLANGFRGDYFQYLTTGSTAGLRKVETLYPELALPA